MSVARRAPVMLGVGLLLGACSLWPISVGPPAPLAVDAGYSGSDSAQVEVRVTQIGCCYIEGSLFFAQLSGPTSLVWQTSGRTTRTSTDSFDMAERPVTLKPGSYTISLWQRPCDGSCGYLDPEVARCSASFDAAAGDELVVDARFPLEKGCSVQVETR